MLPWECVHREKWGPRGQEQGLNAELGKLGELLFRGEKQILTHTHTHVHALTSTHTCKGKQWAGKVRRFRRWRVSSTVLQEESAHVEGGRKAQSQSTYNSRAAPCCIPPSAEPCARCATHSVDSARHCSCRDTLLQVRKQGL